MMDGERYQFGANNVYIGVLGIYLILSVLQTVASWEVTAARKRMVAIQPSVSISIKEKRSEVSS